MENHEKQVPSFIEPITIENGSSQQEDHSLFVDDRLDKHEDLSSLFSDGVLEPKWIDDISVTNCPSCNVLFSLTERKHHCRVCGSIYCENCSKKRIALSSPPLRDPLVAASNHPNESSKLHRVCGRCYIALSVKKATEYFCDKVPLPKKSRLRSSEPQKLTFRSMDDPKQFRQLKINTEINGNSAMLVNPLEGFEQYMNAKQISSSNILADDSNDTGSHGSKISHKDPWQLYRSKLMHHGRAVVIQCHSTDKVELVGSIATGRGGVTVLGCKTVTIKGCILRGECALEVRNNSHVRVEKCILISDSKAEYKEDNIIAPWGALTLQERDSQESAMKKSMGPCLPSGCAVYVDDVAMVELFDCIVIGYTGVYVTNKSQTRVVNSYIKSVGNTIDLWDEAAVSLHNVTCVGPVQINAPFAKYFIEEVSAENNRSSVEWVQDKSASACAQCTEIFTLMNRKHHCRFCGKIYCDACLAERATIPHLHLKELMRICPSCVNTTMQLVSFNLEQPLSPITQKEDLSDPSHLPRIPGTSGLVKTFERVVDPTLAYRLNIPIEFSQVEADRYVRWMYTLREGSQLYTFYIVVSVAVLAQNAAEQSADENSSAADDSKVPIDITATFKKRLQRYQNDIKLMKPETLKVKVRHTKQKASSVLLKEADFKMKEGKRKNLNDPHVWTFEVYFHKYVLKISLYSDFAAFDQGLCQNTFRKVVETFELIDLKALSQLTSSTAQPSVDTSKQFKEYTDYVNRFMIDIPRAASVKEKTNITTKWQTPDRHLTISVNVTNLPSEHGTRAMYEDAVSAHKKRLANNDTSRDFNEWKIKCGDEECFGFLVKEVVGSMPYAPTNAVPLEANAEPVDSSALQGSVQGSLLTQKERDETSIEAELQAPLLRDRTPSSSNVSTSPSNNNSPAPEDSLVAWTLHLFGSGKIYHLQMSVLERKFPQYEKAMDSVLKSFKPLKKSKQVQ